MAGDAQQPLPRDEARRILVEGLEAAGLEVAASGDDRWMTMLAGEWKRTIPVRFELGDRSLKLTSLFSGVLDEGHAEVYRILLQRNQRSGPVHFALDDEGDLIITGNVPLAGFTTAVLDEVLGAVLDLADRTFNQVLRTGFATYLEAEQRWRRDRGMPPNPVGDARR